MAMTPEQLERMQAGKRAARERRAAAAAARERRAAAAAPVAEQKAALDFHPSGVLLPPLDPLPEPEMMSNLEQKEAAAKYESDPAAVTALYDPDPFDRFVADLDPETRELLTDGDGSTPQLRAIFEAEVKKAKEARREVARKQAAVRAGRLAKTDAGLIAPEDAAAAEVQRYMNKKVSWVVEMVRDPNGNLIDEGYRIDGRLYTDGEVIKDKTMAHYLSYREQFWRAKQGEMDFEGKGLLNEHRRLSTGSLSVSMGRAA
jgi:hypothetical protein